MKYVAIRNSVGFRGKYWREGETFDSIEGEIIPPHFVPDGQQEPKVVLKNDKMAPQPATFGKPSKVTTGFAAGVDQKIPEKVVSKKTRSKK